MTTLSQKTKSVRKTFTVPNYIIEELELYANEIHEKQSRIVSLALEEYLQKKCQTDKIEKRQKALKGLIGIASAGTLTNVDKKEIREAIVEKYYE